MLAFCDKIEYIASTSGNEDTFVSLFSLRKKEKIPGQKCK